MRVTVFGAGAIGGIIVARLAGIAPVSVVARGEHLAAIRRNGLTLVGRDGTETTVAPPASDDPGALQPADLVLVTLKAHALPAAAGMIARAMKPGGVAVFIQNGLPWWYLRSISLGAASRLDPHGELSRLFPRVGAGIAHVGGMVVAPGIVRHTGEGGIILGSADGAIDPRLSELATALTEAGLPAQLSSDIAQGIWSKLAINVAINSVAVLTRAGIAQILDTQPTKAIVLAVAHEVATLAHCFGYDVSFDLARQRRIVGSEQKSSTLIDIENGRIIEFESLFGAVLALAADHDVSMPILSTLVPLVEVAARWCITAPIRER